jgi:hypothetical protein
MLEKFIQFISQDPVIGVSDQFNDFFVKAQQVIHFFLYLFKDNVNKSKLNLNEEEHAFKIKQNTNHIILGIPRNHSFSFRKKVLHYL